MITSDIIEAMKTTKKEIYIIRKKIDEVSDSKERYALESKLKELQYLQLWYIQQMEFR